MSCVSCVNLWSVCPVCMYKLLIPSFFTIATDKMSSFSLSDRNFSGLFSAVSGGSFFCFQPLMGTLQTPAAELTIQDFDLLILYTLHTFESTSTIGCYILHTTQR